MEKAYSIIIDIGNSQISGGIFDGLKLLHRFDVDSEIGASYTFGTTLLECLEKNKIDKEEIKDGYICSVVPRLTRWIQIVINQLLGFNCEILSDNVQNRIKKDPAITENIGADLIADILGACRIYGTPCLITDLGTVTKTIIVDKDKVFLGAKFYPGLKVSIESMGEKAALLPSFESLNIDRDTPPEFQYGKNTVDCMRAGIYWATVSSIMYSNKVLTKELGPNTKHIITGGYCKLISKALTDQGMIIDPDLVLKGLAYIANENK